MRPSVRKWIPALFGLALISPLFELPRPTNVSSIPWRVELLLSIVLLVTSYAAFRSQTLNAAFRKAFEEPRIRILVALMTAFCVWSGLSAVWAASPTAAFHHTLLWANYTVVFVFAVAIASSQSGKTAILLTIAIPALLLSGLAAFDFLTIQDFSAQEGTLRIRYGKFAEMLAAIVPVLIASALLARNRIRFVMALAIGSAAWIGVMLSLSKGAFLAGAAGILFLLFSVALLRRDATRKALAAAAVWILVTAVFQFGISSFTTVPSTVNYISGSADATRSTSDMRIYTWRVGGEMIASHFFLGVGADNFGGAFNAARASLARALPQDPDSAIGEYFIFQRAHNEPIQVFAELGLVGIAIFGALFFAAAFFLAGPILQKRRRLSPLFLGGIGGMIAFGSSSLVSSFSFRAYQNGVVFFLILGFTIASARFRAEKAGVQTSDRWKVLKPMGVVLPALLLVFSVIKASSQFVLLAGERSTQLETATGYFRIASRLDPDNPGAELAAAEANVREKRWAEAVPHFRQAIDRGFGISLIYSYMANAQEMAGDLAGAERSLREAAAIFPRSAFINARLAVVLEKQGRFEEAGERLSLSRSLDERQTNGWYSVIKDGILKAHLNSQADPARYAAPPELLPANAIHAYNTDKVRVD